MGGGPYQTDHHLSLPAVFMHARELVELAAVVTEHGPLVIASSAMLPQSSLERYWSGAKCRLDRWGRSLKRLGESPRDSQTRGEKEHHLGVLEEVVTADVLARVWTAVLAGHDRRTNEDAATIARTILVGQQEAQNRAMSLLVNGVRLERAQALRLDRLRRRAECWSDLLVGYLSTTHDLCEFAADPVRAREFATDFREEGTQRWRLLLASLRASFAAAFEAPSPNPDLNAEIAAGVIACFQPEVFDSTGLLRSQWMSRLQNTTEETQGMIDSLFAEELTAPSRLSAQPGMNTVFHRRRFLL